MASRPTTNQSPAGTSSPRTAKIKKKVIKKWTIPVAGNYNYHAYLSFDPAEDEEKRNNNDRVSKIYTGLKQRGLNIVRSETETTELKGLKESALVIVLLTQKYINNVQSGEGNNYNEFMYTKQQTAASSTSKMIAIPMEMCTMDANAWPDAIVNELGNDLSYEASFPTDDPKIFDKQINALFKLIIRNSCAPAGPTITSTVVPTVVKKKKKKRKKKKAAAVATEYDAEAVAAEFSQAPHVAETPEAEAAEEIAEAEIYEEEELEELNARLNDRLQYYTIFIWDKYDIDNDGSLNASEFEAFLRVITQRGDAITSEDCQRFLRQINKSGDGKLQRSELVEFASGGFNMVTNPELAKEYAARSLMHELLVIFVTNLRNAVLNDKEFDMQVKAAKLVEKIWSKYDTDGNGTLDASEIQALISEVMCWTGKGDDVTLEEAERFIGFLDTDGDGLISQQEFVKFMCTAMAMTIDSRINFATRSAMHAKVMVFCTNLAEESSYRV
jgi:Ca2+-binding EF-hand superfamily protein